MKKIIIVTVACLCSFTAIGQINVSATIARITRDSVAYIYTTITNNSSEVLKISDGGVFEPKCNCILEESNSGAYFTGFSNNMTPIYENNNYPLSSPHGDKNPIIDIKPGKTYTTFTGLYAKDAYYGIINDLIIAPNIIYLNANIKIMYIYQNEFRYLTVTTNRLKIK